VVSAATILGSGGFIPTGRRETSSLLLLGPSDDTAVVVDAGTGIRRLLTDPSLLQGRTRVEIVLTHFHVDHICGLAYLGELEGVDAIRVHGPGAALYGAPTATVLEQLFSPPIMPVGLDVLGLEVTELALGESEIGGLALRTRAQEHHTDPTMALRFGDALAWCTDTAPDPGTAPFASGVAVLGHEAWGPPAAPGHTVPEDAGRMAREAGAAHLVLIHVPPKADEDDLRARAATEHDDVTVAHDLLALPVR
jgi:ribonuclease BN (tRNA processing enzyme)